jgi:feruloyl esterase
MLPAIAAWVEESNAPDMILATKYKNSDATGGVERTRPLCVFPAHAQWDGKGDKTKMDSYRCVAGRM